MPFVGFHGGDERFDSGVAESMVLGGLDQNGEVQRCISKARDLTEITRLSVTGTGLGGRFRPAGAPAGRTASQHGGSARARRSLKE